MQSTVLGSYKAELREFRALQEELEPWTQAFKEDQGRKPTLADVQATRERPPLTLLSPYKPSAALVGQLCGCKLADVQATHDCVKFCLHRSRVSRKADTAGHLMSAVHAQLQQLSICGSMRRWWRPDCWWAEGDLLLLAGISWLISKYKQYVLMRERLLNDTQKLRTKLEKSIPEPNSSGTCPSIILLDNAKPPAQLRSLPTPYAYPRAIYRALTECSSCVCRAQLTVIRGAHERQQQQGHQRQGCRRTHVQRPRVQTLLARRVCSAWRAGFQRRHSRALSSGGRW